jgi:hypothetical protein
MSVSLAAALAAKEGSIKPFARRPSQRAVSEELNIATETFREQLESVQKTGMCFSGFNEDELDFLVEYLSYLTYTNGELLASCGEEASQVWRRSGQRRRRPGGARQGQGLRRVSDLGRLARDLQHLLHVDEGLADFPIGEAENIQR